MPSKKIGLLLGEYSHIDPHRPAAQRSGQGDPTSTQWHCDLISG